MASQGIQRPLAVEEAEHLIRTSVAEALPAIGVDVIHEQGDVFLCETVEGAPFRQDITDKLVFFSTLNSIALN